MPVNGKEVFAARFDAARRFDVQLEGLTFHIRRPSEHALRNAAEQNPGPGGDIQVTARATRQVLNDCVIGWEGVTEKTVDSEVGTDTPLPFSRENLHMLLDWRQDIADDIATNVFRDFKARRDRMEGTIKNSESVSTGT